MALFVIPVMDPKRQNAASVLFSPYIPKEIIGSYIPVGHGVAMFNFLLA
jgi:hypothetical protein